MHTYKLKRGHTIIKTLLKSINVNVLMMPSSVSRCISYDVYRISFELQILSFITIQERNLLKTKIYGLKICCSL